MAAPGSLLLSRLMGRESNDQTDETDARIFISGTSLKVSNPPLSSDGCSELLQAVEKSQTVITEIDLSGCNISKADELAELIRSCEHLQRLLLEGNSIGLARTGILSLTSAIALSSTLTELDLRNNRIGPSFAAALANALRGTRSLCFIDLRWNSLGPSGAAAFINLLQKNPILAGIQLAGNGIPQKLLSEIDKLVEDNRANCVTPQVRAHVPHPLEEEFKWENREGMKAIYSGRIAAMVEEINNLKSHVVRVFMFSNFMEIGGQTTQDLLKKEKEDTKLEVLEAENHVKALKLELTEEALLRKYADKEANQVKEELYATQQKLARAEEKLAEDARVASSTAEAHNAALAEAGKRVKAAEERYDAVVSENISLKDQIACNKNEHLMQLRSVQENAATEQHNAMSNVKRLDFEHRASIEAHAKEVMRMQAEFEAEIKRVNGEKEAALREVEALKSMTSALEMQFAAKEKALQLEKEQTEQVLQARVANVKSEMESLQAELDNMRREVSKARKKHTSEIEEYETKIAQSRTLQHRMELAKSDLEERIFALTSDKVQLEEKSKLAEDRERLLEKKMELEKLKYAEQTSGEISRHIEEKRRIDGELQSARIQLHNMRNSLEELQAEQERRKVEVEKRVLGVETQFIDCIRQQFAGLRNSQSHRIEAYGNL
ncbi:leucine-rich repeat-containing protein 45 isoform X2 [Selaginella moellendorffii]|uniref:leucine-rich repeat-containing protein 45 isoform X2 n=1 Tax=Selaginella moellendorffii TaxID=88036 RepID=UPI000D1C46E6|nr:leucine-rich repeat-containing protein 45 isoform X2 [Selaginella moellendorffii]|eukprot:XP_024518460.1 leucine-rich repeat-containing protein 45 isoform X2 [Selaginella moellendorffii]